MLPDPPNVVIFLLDDVGIDAVSPYGFPDAPPTPTLQGLADVGLRFDQAWATPVCSPTRAALLSGQYARENHIGAVLHARSTHELPLGLVLLPEALDGWDSAVIGKWHLATADSPSGRRHPLVQGFDWFAGSLNNILVPARIPPEIDRSYVAWERVGFDGTLAVETAFSTSKIADDAIVVMDELTEPFLLYVAFHAAHRPWMPPPDVAMVEPYTDADLYEANVRSMDNAIGRVLNALGDRKDRTLVWVIGDNGTPGGALADEGMDGAKGSFTEGGLRVPFLVAGPGVVHGNTDALVHVVDVYPTVTALAGLPSDPSRPGRSLVRQFAAPGGAEHAINYTETRHPAEGPPWRRMGQAARDDTLKVTLVDDVRTVYRLSPTAEVAVKPRALDRSERKRLDALEQVLVDRR